MDRIIDYIITLINSSVKTARGIAQVYHGEYWLIPENSLPCIIVDGISENVQTTDSQNDSRIFTIEIKVIMDARTKFNNSATTFSAKKTIEQIIGEAETTMAPKSDTIMYMIRHTLDANNAYVLKADISNINYVVNVNREFPTLEGIVTITATSKLFLR